MNPLGQHTRRPSAVPVYLAVIVTILAGIAGCGGSQAQALDPVAVPSAPPMSDVPPSAPDSTPADDCPFPQSGFDCDFQRRFAAVEAYVGTRPGTVGIVVHDRRTGAVWRNNLADTPVWTASTIKLAMAVDLFTRDRNHTITLSNSDRELIHAMLHSSDDNAADALWFKYAGPDHLAFNDDFPRYGLSGLKPERGYSKFYPYWGFHKCTPNDLDRLIGYALTQLPPPTRDYLVEQMKTVDVDQQWGVWAAGPAAAPGNKNGWSQEDTGWVMNSVGFVGPDQRYTLSVMNSLNGQGGYDDGRTTDSHIAELLFANRTL